MSPTLSLRQEWHALWDCPPGKRFERRYLRSRRLQEHEELVPRILRLILAVVIFMAGVGAIFLPLPEFVFFAISGALLAAESLSLARFLDQLELGAARRWERFKEGSGLSPFAFRLLSLTVAICTVGLSTCFCCRTLLE